MVCLEGVDFRGGDLRTDWVGSSFNCSDGLVDESIMEVVAESIPLYSVCSESLTSLSGFGDDISMRSFLRMNCDGKV
jgi:hypothetical protein